MSTIRKRLDAWYNAVTGLGNVLRDKAANTYYQRGRLLTDDYLENLYHGDDMAARICDALPEAALRNGYFLSAEDEDTDLSSALHEYQKRLKFRRALQEAAVWSRVFGGAVVYLGMDDGGAEDEPLNEANIRSIDFATVLDKRTLTPHTTYQTLDRYGDPELYQIGRVVSGRNDGTLVPGSMIHESRLIRLDGARTSLWRREYNNGWSESVLEKVHTVLRDFGASWQNVGHLMQDAAQGVFKIKGLTDMVASEDGCSLLNARMRAVDMYRSDIRAILLDADSEEFERAAYAFTGIPDILRLFMTRLSAAAQMPVTVLFGQSPAGLNATGESDIRLWYDSITTYQQDHLLDAVTRFYELVFMARDFEGSEPEAWEVRFGRLWQMSDKEQADLEKVTADKDKVYVDAGVLLPEEIAINRFKARGFSLDTQIDMDARMEMLQAEIELAKEHAGEEPVPPPMPGQAPQDPSQDPESDPREDAVRLDFVRKRNGKWVVLSKSGKVLGRHTTRKQALDQLRAVEASKEDK